jgi:hypothetical protein
MSTQCTDEATTKASNQATTPHAKQRPSDKCNRPASQPSTHDTLARSTKEQLVSLSVPTAAIQILSSSPHDTVLNSSINCNLRTRVNKRNKKCQLQGCRLAPRDACPPAWKAGPVHGRRLAVAANRASAAAARLHRQRHRRNPRAAGREPSR